MKRVGSLVLTLIACFVSATWAQPAAAVPRFGKQWLPRHRMVNGMPRTLGANGLNSAAPAAAAATLKTWDLGTYPGGTWAQLLGINNFGVAAGWGDVAGDTRMIGVPLFGPNAGKWFESGVSSQDDPWVPYGSAIADTGLIVGSITGKDGEARAYAWSPSHGGVDLGTLEGDKGSDAIAVNHLGTLIVGVSYPEAWDISTAVAWTPEMRWHEGKWTVTWKIHKLPTGGLDQPGRVYEGDTLSYWGGWGVNDLGQIAGDGWSPLSNLAVVWNPIHGGKEWEIQRLPSQSTHPIVADHMYTGVAGINNRGEIVGYVSAADGWSALLPALWTTSPKVHTWELTELPTLSGERTGSCNWCVWGINDLGDAVGQSVDADGNYLATRWLTRNPSFVKAIGFPGDTSVAFYVNNLGIAVGSYNSGGPDQAFAAAIH